MKKPQAIQLYIDNLEELEALGSEQTGKLIVALLRYADKGETPDFSDDITLRLVFNMLRRRIDRDFERYAQTCEKRRLAGKKGGAPKGNTNAAKQPRASKTTQTEAETKTEAYTQGVQKSRASSPRYIVETNEVIEHLNLQTGRNFHATAKSTQRKIGALLEQGFTTEDMKRAVDKMVREWRHTEYEKYLRPETLFGDKFDSYLNMPQTPTLPKRKPGDAWYDPAYAAELAKWENNSMFND